MIFLRNLSFVKIFLKHYCVTMTTTLNTSCSENIMVLSEGEGVSACMYFLVIEIKCLGKCVHTAYHVFICVQLFSVNVGGNKFPSYERSQ